MKKKETPATKVNKAEAFRCGECLHFKNTPHRTHKAVCSKEGVRNFAEAPRCYTPDYTKVIGNIDEFTAIVTFFGSKTPQQKKILLGMLRTASSGRKLKLGLKVYFNTRNREYISNYLSAFVVGYTSSGEIVLAGSPDRNKRGQVFFAYLTSDSSLMSEKSWRAQYDIMLRKGRLVDPKVKQLPGVTESIKEQTYEIPTIDKAPKNLERDVAKKTIKKKSMDLVDIYGGFSF